MEHHILIEFLTLVAFAYLAFFKSYLTEKGRSTAMKEDLDKVTREVEGIRHEFLREHEYLKTELQRILNIEVSYRDEERNALIQFYSMNSEWLFSILEVNFGNYNRNNLDALISIRNNISTFFAKTGIAKSKIELLVDDKDVVSLAQKLHTATLTFHHWTDARFFELQHNSESHKSLTERFLIIIKNFDANRELAQEMVTEEQRLIEESKELFADYMANRNFEYFKVKPIESEFAELVKKYLKN